MRDDVSAKGAYRSTVVERYKKDPIAAMVIALEPVAYLWLAFLADLDHTSHPYRIRQRIMAKWRKALHQVLDETLKSARIEHALKDKAQGR